MAFKDVLVLLFGDDDDAGVIQALSDLQVFSEAHVAASLIAPVPDPIFVGDMAGGGIGLAEFVTAARADAKAAQERVRTLLSRANFAFEERLILAQALTACDMVAVQARHVDLTVLARPSSAGSGYRFEVMEAALMQSGRPLLLTPPKHKINGAPKTVFVAWNAGREAARALADATPWLTGAKIVVATIDARQGLRGHGEAPGVDIATHLARHGHAVELRNVDGLGASVGEAILKAADSAGADLIVSGGFGHARLQQALFGGVTRTLVENASVPLLLSH